MTPAESAIRAQLFDIRHPEREGWSCADDGNVDHVEDCDPPTWLLRDDDGNGTPLCDWHAQERVHDALPEFTNCTGCGTQHAALWPDGAPE